MTQLSSLPTQLDPPGPQRRPPRPWRRCWWRLQFLTVMPPLVRRSFRDEEFGRSVGFFPLVGLILGAVLMALDIGPLRLLPHSVASALLLAAWVLATVALHLDGFLDSCDGLFGGRTADDRLRTYARRARGAYAVIGGILLLLVKYSALSSLAERAWALLLVPIIGRWLISLAVVLYPYARQTGLGRSMKDHAGLREATLATVLALAPLVVGGWTSFATAVAALLTGWAVVRVAGCALARPDRRRVLARSAK